MSVDLTKHLRFIQQEGLRVAYMGPASVGLSTRLSCCLSACLLSASGCVCFIKQEPAYSVYTVLVIMAALIACPRGGPRGRWPQIPLRMSHCEPPSARKVQILFPAICDIFISFYSFFVALLWLHPTIRVRDFITVLKIFLFFIFVCLLTW